MTDEELVVRIQAGELDRLPEMWKQVSNFVDMQAGKRARALYGFGGVTAEDLYQSGYIALVNAIDSYKIGGGMPFIGWLALYLKRAFAEAGGFKYSRCAHDPLHRAGSLDAPFQVGEGKPVTLIDTLPDTCADQDLQDVEDRVWLEQLRAALDTALAELPDKQNELLRRRYYTGQTLKQITADMGIGETTVYRWEKEAFQKLRRRKDLQQFV